MIDRKTRLMTPFGSVHILIDGKEIDYVFEKLTIIENCANVKGRYRIRLIFIPDGKAHSISCVLPDMVDFESDYSSGADTQQITFHNKENWALEIGIIGDMYGQNNRSIYNEEQDYDVDYLDRGLCYLILKETATQEYDFILAWIDGMDYGNYDNCRGRLEQLWRCSDPSFAIN